jgi:predicted dehydrogenase
MMRLDRRMFLQTAGLAAAQTFTGKLSVLTDPFPDMGQAPSANDHINLALIGAGIQGQGDTRWAVQVPGVKLVAVADCYDGRLAHMKEVYGNDLFTTRDYREILARKDVDAVLIATPDHWHKQASIDAMNAGKDVYCEKPMIHLYSDGHAMIDTAKKTQRIIQIGSQRVSNILYAKAKELLAAGAIGDLNLVSAHWDRSLSQGAWNYTVPLDASPTTCDWERFEGTAPKIPFNAERFFQWRKWKDYGSGVAGDLFVHLFSGTHFITGSNGPTRGMATGGIRYWKDGRDVPDVMLGIFDYPQGFNLSLRVNFASGGDDNEGFLFTGSEGTMEINGQGLTISHAPHPKDPGYTIGTYTTAMQKQILEQYDAKYPPPRATANSLKSSERYTAPKGYSDSYDHFHNFFDAVRTRKAVTEDATFGLRAAGAALLSNESIRRDGAVKWDPEAMLLAKA